ncbi:MAG: 4Fe-4S binding protein, partial [Polaromonas sp.]|nr:4Fe-4S binding protein [Polaromonas sp.]
KLMHTVIEPYCTGCELCIPVCPVDCISLENVTGPRTGWSAWSATEARQAQTRYEFHSYRATAGMGQNPEMLEESAPAPESPPLGLQKAATPEVNRKQAVIEAALARARALRNKP